jgi:uncharacterized protein YecT (DUF1311 family)
MNKRNLLIVMISMLFLFLAACGDSSDKSNADSKNQDKSNNTSQNENDDSTNTDIDDEKTEETAAASDEEQSEEDGTSNASDSKDTAQANGDDGMKSEYLAKLNKMEEDDKHAEAKETTVGMEEQEQQRYEKWDKALNEIYGTLEEQLSKEEMDKLRDEQREWVQQRDAEAKKASLKYEGGTTESLEYAATQATLTKERAYYLVAHYLG